MEIKEFPAEFFIQLAGSDFLLGRLTINKMNQSFFIEIDIVQKESRKIWAHVANLYDLKDLDEARDLAVMRLAEFLGSSKK